MAVRNIAIACQGGGSHAAYSAGVLQQLLPVLDEKNQDLRLVGISGTSGGAICALLAWYGWLIDGAETAARKLETFWQSNCALLPGERLWNESLVGTMGALSCDIKFSPYDWPLREEEEIVTRWWPVVARAMGNGNLWMRGDFFQLGELVRPHVDFDLVQALGDFCSIPLEIKQWLSADFQAGMLVGNEACRQHFDQIKSHLQKSIDNGLAAPAKIRKMMDAADVPADAPLRRTLNRWSERTWTFESGALLDLSNAVLKITNEIPQLLLGAVDIGNGEFFAFSSERSCRNGGISVESVLASAALPWLFQAVAIEQESPDGKPCPPRRYWDGLFSQNPPIKNFISGLIDDSKKPDEFWVVQINPDEFTLKPRRQALQAAAADALSGNEIWHTRDALSGNLSLNQEISFLESINKIIGDGMKAADSHYKQVQAHRIVMDGRAVESALGRRLGVFSKFDRDPKLKESLVAHGREQAARFLSVREVIAQAGSDLGSIPHVQPSDGGAMTDAVIRTLKSLRSEDGKDKARLIVDGTTLHRQSAPANADEPQVVVRWHAKGKTASGKNVSLDGDAHLGVSGRASTTWRLSDVAIANIEQTDAVRTTMVLSKRDAVGEAARR
jgi:predicted acylesterase/phospholipase RssA